MYLLAHFARLFSRQGAAGVALSAAALLSAATAHAQQVLRVSAIPDEAPTELQRKFKPLGNYLEQKLGMKVEFVPVTDYAASVEGLINHKLDMVWFGGFTFVQAKVRSGGKVMPIVQREEDQQFKSVFITTDKSINKLEDQDVHAPQFQRQIEHGARWERKDLKQVLAQDDKFTYALRNDGTILATGRDGDLDMVETHGCFRPC